MQHLLPGYSESAGFMNFLCKTHAKLLRSTSRQFTKRLSTAALYLVAQIIARIFNLICKRLGKYVRYIEF